MNDRSSQELNSNHKPVLLEELILGLSIEKNRWYLDCTFGAGGHSKEVLKQGGKIIAIDRDINNEKYANDLKKEFPENFIFYNRKFSNIKDILERYEISGIFYDFGVSSMQIDEPERGFSFQKNGPLDMRMGFNEENANLIVNQMPEEDLANLIYNLGNERYSRKIAKEIVRRRKEKTFETTLELAEFIKQTVKGYKDKIHPATRTFQAIRIFVNNELEEIEESLKIAILNSKENTKIITISFHSLEDKIIKNLFREYSQEYKNLGFNRNDFRVMENEIKKEAILKIITKKPIIPTDREIKENIRSRSAKLRIAIRK